MYSYIQLINQSQCDMTFNFQTQTQTRRRKQLTNNQRSLRKVLCSGLSEGGQQGLLFWGLGGCISLSHPWKRLSAHGLSKTGLARLQQSPCVCQTWPWGGRMGVWTTPGEWLEDFVSSLTTWGGWCLGIMVAIHVIFLATGKHLQYIVCDGILKRTSF